MAASRLGAPGSLLAAGPRLQVWRAPTDNDVHMARGWREAGLDRLWHRTVRTTVTAQKATRSH